MNKIHVSCPFSLCQTFFLNLHHFVPFSPFCPKKKSLLTLFHAGVGIRAYQFFLFFKFQYWGVFFWCIFMCRTNVRKYIFFKNAIFLYQFDNQFYKGIGSKIQREMCRFGFLHFMLQN